MKDSCGFNLVPPTFFPLIPPFQPNVCDSPVQSSRVVRLLTCQFAVFSSTLMSYLSLSSVSLTSTSLSVPLLVLFLRFVFFLRAFNVSPALSSLSSSIVVLSSAVFITIGAVVFLLAECWVCSSSSVMNVKRCYNWSGCRTLPQLTHNHKADLLKLHTLHLKPKESMRNFNVAASGFCDLWQLCARQP